MFVHCRTRVLIESITIHILIHGTHTNSSTSLFPKLVCLRQSMLPRVFLDLYCKVLNHISSRWLRTCKRASISKPLIISKQCFLRGRPGIHNQQRCTENSEAKPCCCFPPILPHSPIRHPRHQRYPPAPSRFLQSPQYSSEPLACQPSSNASPGTHQMNGDLYVIHCAR